MSVSMHACMHVFLYVCDATPDVLLDLIDQVRKVGMTHVTHRVMMTTVFV